MKVVGLTADRIDPGSGAVKGTGRPFCVIGRQLNCAPTTRLSPDHNGIVVEERQPPRRGWRILVVDEEEDTRGVVARVLGPRGAEVVGAAWGEGAGPAL